VIVESLIMCRPSGSLRNGEVLILGPKSLIMMLRGRFSSGCVLKSASAVELPLSHCGETDEYRLVCNRTLVEKIPRLCSMLEDLTLPVPRTWGYTQEASIYRVLGTLLKLQNLSLTLVISNPRTEFAHSDETQCSNDPSFDAFEQQSCLAIMHVTHSAITFCPETDTFETHSSRTRRR
jgi:hypothetical protein